MWFQEFVFETEGVKSAMTEEVYTFAVDRVHCIDSFELGHGIGLCSGWKLGAFGVCCGLRLWVSSLGFEILRLFFYSGRHGCWRVDVIPRFRVKFGGHIYY